MQWSGYEPVLAVSLDDTEVGVVRMPNGALLFPGRITSRGGTVLSGYAAHATRVQERTVIAGRLLPGVARVVVIDDAGDEYAAVVGDEVWVAVAGTADASETLVRYEDAAGALIPQPVPDGPRTVVEDAVEACPVCGTSRWVQIGEGVYCDRCGLRVGAGLFFMRMAVADEDDDDEWEEDDEVEDEYEPDEDWEARFARGRAEAAAQAPFPIYAAHGREPVIGSYSSGDDGIKSVMVVHQDGAASLQVETDAEEHWGEDRLQRKLAALLAERAFGGERSEAAERVHYTDVSRTAGRRAERAMAGSLELMVDGRPEPFEAVCLDDLWVARRDHHDLRIEVIGRGVDPATVSLVALGQRSPEAERRHRAVAGELLTRAELAALVDEHDLSEHREAILAAIRPGWRLRPVDEDAPHRIGGLPDLAAGEQWPLDEHGIPLTFVAQIDTSRLPPLTGEVEGPAWDHGGRLIRLFAALDGREGESGMPAVALACAPDAPLTRAELPPRPDPLPEGLWFGEEEDDSMRRLEEQPVSATPFLTARVGWYVLGDEVWASGYDELGAVIAAGGAKPRRDAWADAQLLGHASNEQGEDPIQSGWYEHRDSTALEDWCTLFSLPRHPGMSFGDGGSLAIVIPCGDLAAGRYDRLVVDTSTG